MSFEEQMEFLDESLRKLKIQYELYFAGIRRVPPAFEKGRLDTLVHDMSREKIRETSVRFRFNALIARYNHYRELWGRLEREREEGPLDYRRRQQAFRLAEAKLAAAHQDGPAAAPVTSGENGSYVRVTPTMESESVARLYSEILEAQTSLGKAVPTLDQVGAMVRKQAETLRAKFGVAAVGFRVEVVNGKVKLKAKPLRDGQPE